MSRPLLACLLLLASISAAAAPKARPRKPVVVPKTKTVDKQAFEQTYQLVFLQAGQSFLKDEPMPDPEVLEAFRASLLEPELSSATAAKQRIEALIGDAECVQAGPGAVATDVYTLMVGHVSRSLDVGAIVEQNFLPNGRAGRSLDAGEKVLVAACQAEARNQAYDRRGYYQYCLGRKVSEGVYLDAARMASVSGGPGGGPSCPRVLAAVAADKSRFAPKMTEDLARKIEATRAGLLSGLAVPGDGGAVVAPWETNPVAAGVWGKRAPPRGGATDLRQAAGLKVNEPPLNSADLSAGTKLARIAVNDEIGFTGYCYSYVKSALQKAGIVDRSAIDSQNAGAHAKLFAEFVEKHPALLKRKLLRIPVPSWPLPIGTVVVWSPSACGYSAKSGHIEIVTRIKPPQACSDGCGTFQTACLDELGADPGRARAELSKAETEYLAAKADYDGLAGGKNTTALRAAKAVFLKKKTALAAVQARLEPKVAAYVIERPGQPKP